MYTLVPAHGIHRPPDWARTNAANEDRYYSDHAPRARGAVTIVPLGVLVGLLALVVELVAR